MKVILARNEIHVTAQFIAEFNGEGCLYLVAGKKEIFDLQSLFRHYSLPVPKIKTHQVVLSLAMEIEPNTTTLIIVGLQPFLQTALSKSGMVIDELQVRDQVVL